MTHEFRATTRSGESGIALIMVLFLTLVLSVIGSSLMFVSRSETISAYSYKTTSQARYAAESGLHDAANYLLWTYQAPGTPGAAIADPLANYDMTGQTVTFGGNTVVLSSDGEVDANYPIEDVSEGFADNTSGELALDIGTATYSASARLLSMRQFNDAFSGTPVTLQTWEITGRGRAGDVNAAEVEVTAIVERQDSPVFKYAAFATATGCDALVFGGGAETDSYDSRLYAGVGTPVMDAYGGNVGTNGSMTGLGVTTTVNGSLSTPRTGVGNCTNANVTAFDTNGATVTDGIRELPQNISFPAPPAISPLPPTSNSTFNGGCAAGTAAFCSTVAGSPGIDPSLVGGTVTLGAVRVQSGTNLRLKAGTYIVDSLSFSGNATLTVEGGGPIIIRVAGQGAGTTPIDFTGGSITNNAYDPSTLQFFYSGTKNIKLTGGSASAALVYAPNAKASFSGGQDFYGAVVAKEITDMGGAAIHYDRKLQTEALTAGNPLMGAFTWRMF